MRSLKLFVLALLVAGMTGCACRTKKMGGPEGNIDGLSASPMKDVNFAFDSSKIDSRAMMVLKENAEYMKNNPSVKVQVEGHCDERGTVEYNMALGARRAQACFNSLKSLGTDAGRMSTLSYGEELPLDPGHNEAAWAKNRRCHFSVR